MSLSNEDAMRLENYYLKNINTVNDFINLNRKIVSSDKPSQRIGSDSPTNMGEANPYYQSPSTSPINVGGAGLSASSSGSSSPTAFGHSFTCSVTGATVTSWIG